MLNNIVGSSRALERALAGEELTFNDGLELMRDDNLFMLGSIADKVRKEIKGDVVTFTASYYLNYTNVCAASCPLCAFYRKGKEPGDRKSTRLNSSHIQKSRMPSSA